MIHVTQHAIIRCMQRVPGITTEDEALAVAAHEIHSTATMGG
ncbi:hypothetical protein [Novosphingobium sp. KN65.2]|nr:hypothetical protein [Novosphingobium sp. KN65.2]